MKYVSHLRVAALAGNIMLRTLPTKQHEIFLKMPPTRHIQAFLKSGTGLRTSYNTVT